MRSSPGMTARAKDVDMDTELAHLLQEQEHFLRAKKKPSATVSRRGSASPVSAWKAPETSAHSTFEEDVHVLKGVIERRVVPPAGQQDVVIIAPKPFGFPRVQRRGPGQSLFGRRQREAAGTTMQEQQEEEPVDQETSTIDAGNRVTLQEMSHRAIRDAQEELWRTLDPQLIEKLKTRRKKKDTLATQTTEEKNDDDKVLKTDTKHQMLPQSVAGDAIHEKQEQRRKEQTIKTLAAVKTEEELKQHVALLPEEERAKLEWTQSVNETQKHKHKRGKKIARLVAKDATLERFDLDGQVLEATDAEMPVHSGLFHHGNDPDAAGYTLPELLHLARSSMASQRAMSLNVVARILHHRQLQVNASLPVVPQVLPRDLAITLRIVLDDQNYTALSDGVSALHAFIVPVQANDSFVNEGYLPELKHGIIVLPPKVHIHQNVVGSQAKRREHYAYEDDEVVYIDTAEADDGSSISDEDLAALDPVQALLHMGLVTRLWYILETIQLPDQCATEKILEILIAVARHSPRAAHEIGSNARLLKLLQRQYIENEQVLTFQEGNARSVQLSLKALQLVRALCQGQRSVASALITNGLIQSTKGFLALKEIPTGKDDEKASTLFAHMQVESLRIWRILLGYGLDFHCFAYLFPVLSSFTQNPADTSISRSSALFAALEAFCGLGAVHEAQHYFHQLSFFLGAAKDQAARVIRSLSCLNDVKSVVLLSTVLRFMTAASACATKHNLETSGMIEVLKLVQSRKTTREVLPQLGETVAKRELLLAIVHFHRQIVANDLLADDMDGEEVVQIFSRDIQAPLLTAATSAATSSSSKLSLASIQACELTLLLCDVIAAGQYDSTNCNVEFVQNVYRQALIIVERLGSGGEYLVARLFAGVLFRQRVLLLLGVFNEEAGATRMSRVLIPIYQALVNTSHEQEAHSAQVLAGASKINQFSYHLHLPQEERTFISSNLPLPNFWMVCPLSRMDYSKSGDGNKPPTSVGPTRAQSDEMKLIVSATCRFVYEFEQLAPQMSSISSIAELRPEDKLFHLLHVFFAGSDVLFDDHVNAALRQLLPRLVQPILCSPENSRVLYNGIVRNLNRIQSLESGRATAEPSPGQSAVSLMSDEQQVLAFVEKLMGEYTASSFGNPHFAHCVTLLMTRDFSLELRKFVWKELQESHLLYTLAPFEGCGSELLTRCTRGGTTLAVDSKLLQLMQQAVCKGRVSLARGVFAYSLAIHHLVVYLFAKGDNNVLSSARQAFAQTLIAEASPSIWGHLLSYDAFETSLLLTEERGIVLYERVARLRTQAGFTSDQVVTFEAIVSLLESSRANA